MPTIPPPLSVARLQTVVQKRAEQENPQRATTGRASGPDPLIAYTTAHAQPHWPNRLRAQLNAVETARPGEGLRPSVAQGMSQAVDSSPELSRSVASMEKARALCAKHAAILANPNATVTVSLDCEKDDKVWAQLVSALCQKMESGEINAKVIMVAHANKNTKTDRELNAVSARADYDLVHTIVRSAGIPLADDSQPLGLAKARWNDGDRDRLVLVEGGAVLESAYPPKPAAGHDAPQTLEEAYAKGPDAAIDYALSLANTDVNAAREGLEWVSRQNQSGLLQGCDSEAIAKKLTEATSKIENHVRLGLVADSVAKEHNCGPCEQHAFLNSTSAIFAKAIMQRPDVRDVDSYEASGDVNGGIPRLDKGIFLERAANGAGFAPEAAEWVAAELKAKNTPHLSMSTATSLLPVRHIDYGLTSDLRVPKATQRDNDASVNFSMQQGMKWLLTLVYNTVVPDCSIPEGEREHVKRGYHDEGPKGEPSMAAVMEGLLCDVPSDEKRAVTEHAQELVANMKGGKIRFGEDVKGRLIYTPNAPLGDLGKIMENPAHTLSTDPFLAMAATQEGTENLVPITITAPTKESTRRNPDPVRPDPTSNRVIITDANGDFLLQTVKEAMDARVALGGEELVPGVSHKTWESTRRCMDTAKVIVAALKPRMEELLDDTGWTKVTRGPARQAPSQKQSPRPWHQENPFAPLADDDGDSKKKAPPQPSGFTPDQLRTAVKLCDQILDGSAFFRDFENMYS